MTPAYCVNIGFNESNLFEIRRQILQSSRTDFCLAGNGSSDEVCAKADVGGVGETERGGGHSVDWVGRGKSTKVVVPGHTFQLPLL